MRLPAWLGAAAFSFFSLCLAAPLHAAPAAALPSAAEWAGVVAAAKKEGKVVVYGSFFGSSTYKAVIKSFETRYGIPVETLDIRASEIYERIRVEVGTNRGIGDVVLQPRSATTLIERGNLLQPHGGLPNLANLRPGVAYTPVQAPIQTQLYGLLVNAAVPDAPKSWSDLLDPKWKGKIILDDPRALGNGFSFFNATYKGLGADFQKRLAAQEPVISREVRNDERRVARGEVAMYAPESYYFMSEIKGLPLRFVFPTEGSPAADLQVSMIRLAPHPNAARLFMNHLLDPEAQIIFANAGQLPAIAGIADRVNADVKQLYAVKQLPQVDLDDMNQLMDIAKQLYSK
jgi:iron(III) transport system substrate-binding protein